MQTIYNLYTKVSGLNINISQSTALCINTDPAIVNIIQETGIQTPNNTIRYLGVQLGHTIEGSITATIAHINPKAIRRRILATTPPTDLLHRATLINRALIYNYTLYNHVFMSLPVNNKITEEIFDDILPFLWTRQKEGQTSQKGY